MATATAVLTPAAPAPSVAPAAARPLPGTRTAAIASLGISLPSTIVRNAPIAERIGVSDEWIQKRTGIHSRRILADDERLTDLAAEAGREALEARRNGRTRPRHGARRDDHGRRIAAQRGAACRARARRDPRGIAWMSARRAPAFSRPRRRAPPRSSPAAPSTCCSIGADAMSRITDPNCRQTAALFADGAGAVVLSTSAGLGRIGRVSLGSDGAGADLIVVDRDELRIRMQGPTPSGMPSPGCPRRRSRRLRSPS